MDIQDTPSVLEQKLAQLALDIHQDESLQAWDNVESTAQKLANALRTREAPVDNHTLLGKSALPQSLMSLLTLALHGSATPPPPYLSAVHELLRISANLCMDHDENRARLLEAGFPQAMVLLLEGYIESIPNSTEGEPAPFSIKELKVLRTAIGVLLNVSLGYDPVKIRLISFEAALTILKISMAVYPPCWWLSPSDAFQHDEQGVSEEAWILRSTISDWAWRTVSELKDISDETLQVFNPDVLPLITQPLVTFCPPYTERANALFGPESTVFTLLLNTDFEVLEAACTLNESLSLDVEDIRLALARGLNFPAEHGGVPCFTHMLDFIERGTYPILWQTAFGTQERTRKEKAFDICKAALIKSVVEVAGEESNYDVLWDDSEEEKPGGKFICKMVDWIKNYVSEMDSGATGVGRDDLAICGTLALGNLARRGKISTALLSPPHSLALMLASDHFLSPATDIKLKHGVLGLLKNLAQSSSLSSIIQKSLGDAGIVEKVSASGVWDEKVDAMSDIVQLSAISIVKHMCGANVEHTFALVLPNSKTSSSTGLSQILSLVFRTESIPVRSEGTRVLVNVVKSLWASPSAKVTPPTDEPARNGANSANEAELQTKRESAMTVVLTPECALALTNLIGRSAKYPILVNEGIVALTLLSTHKNGPLVFNALVAPIPSNASNVEPSSPSMGSEASSPARSRLPVPRNSLDMLAFVLRNIDNPANYPVEVRINACAFLVQLSKHVSGEEWDKSKETLRPILEKISGGQHGLQSKDDMLVKATKRVLDTWSCQ